MGQVFLGTHFTPPLIGRVWNKDERFEIVWEVL